MGQALRDYAQEGRRSTCGEVGHEMRGVKAGAPMEDVAMSN